MNSLPHYGAHGCAALGMTTEDRRQGIENKIPPGFNPFGTRGLLGFSRLKNECPSR